MLVVMQEGATEPQIQAVIDRMVSLGFTVHRSTGVLHTVLGGVGTAATGLATTLIQAFVQSLQADAQEETAATVRAIIDYVPQFFA